MASAASHSGNVTARYAKSNAVRAAGCTLSTTVRLLSSCPCLECYHLEVRGKWRLVREPGLGLLCPSLYPSPIQPLYCTGWTRFIFISLDRLQCTLSRSCWSLCTARGSLAIPMSNLSFQKSSLTSARRSLSSIRQIFSARITASVDQSGGMIRTSSGT